ncbi:hypothetical protein K458DRAFT_406557 [Lentithecium fluviatile CBS 122367]|uniref:Uncharacterized protein n=1 Tax=Lentithecium fluviatile CBS 122367 TaxID=1168545 RepID=A0A6G1IT72_9PLEO|nr:hypothetical protein K458DRAFT_406557 [Lentithecium fluviatile CBS 122367]
MPLLCRKRDAAQVFHLGVDNFVATKTQSAVEEKQKQKAAIQSALEKLKADRAAKRRRRESPASAGEASDTSKSSIAEESKAAAVEITPEPEAAVATEPSPPPSTPEEPNVPSSPLPPAAESAPTTTTTTKQRPAPHRSSPETELPKHVARPVIRKPTTSPPSPTPKSSMTTSTMQSRRKPFVPLKLAVPLPGQRRANRIIAAPSNAASTKKKVPKVGLVEEGSVRRHVSEPPNRYQLSTPGRARGRV